jgi:hypothetical protein
LEIQQNLMVCAGGREVPVVQKSGFVKERGAVDQAPRVNEDDLGKTPWERRIAQVKLPAGAR